jgi:hypothetical protein
MSYKIYLDKDFAFECEAAIKNASYKNSSARLILESDDVNLVFYGNVDKNTINVPIKSLKKYFTEKDSAKIKLEVIVENQLVTPWESEVEFDNYNKVEIKEIKNIKQNPLVEIKIKEEPKEEVIVEESKPVDSPKQSLLKNINEEIKKIKANGKINKEAKKELIKNLLQKGL